MGDNLTTTTTIIQEAQGTELLVFVGLAFYLLYLSTTYDNKWLRLLLKSFSIFISVIAAYIPLISVGLAEEIGLYDLFANSYMWGIIFFFAVWFMVLITELLLMFINKDKTDLEEIQ